MESFNPFPSVLTNPPANGSNVRALQLKGARIITAA